ncbi:phosphonoacetaldehyde hydrolase [Thiorhodococcus mannitoliphagus]|uniref:Phosphonoacetaldehyde hydrolase n=1 Tax=Thiorhodococcus mannitoliphagus TaxID=329406 RepID=A0A6P1DN00_9GAMM|nr:phosphonoacetaldehyde hydrolase [Thiorhodococcus mannitoliphagus]
MSDPFEERAFPKGVLIAVAALLSFTIIMIAIARMTGVMLPQAPVTAALESRDIVFVDQEDGSTAVKDVSTGELIQVLPPGGEGFIRGVLRSMERQRRGYDATLAEPFRLARRESGDVTLEDPVTGILLDLRAYGETNQASFAELLPAGSGSD